MERAIALLFVIACAITSVKAQSCANQDADVLILGAGFAGIAAAKTLHDAGVRDFIILEARDRVGGRARQERFAGAQVNVGANWIHGVDRDDPDTHPLWALKEKCQVQGVFTDYDNIAVYNPNGFNIANRYFARSEVFYDFFEAAVNLSIELRENDEPDISVREGLTVVGWSPMSVLDNFIEWFGVDFSLAEPPEVSSLDYPDTTYSDPGFGDSDFFVTDARGYDWLVQCLAEDFLEEDDQRLHLSSTISKVQWSDECVCAVTNEGSETKTYCALYAIVTFSFGVLQNTNVEFDPPLPSDKRETIERIGMANYQLVITQYNNIFWDEQVEFIGYADEQRGYFPLFQTLDQVLPGNPKVVTSTLTGDLGKEVAALGATQEGRKEIIANLTEVFRSIYGPSVPEPLNVLVTNWWDDPLYRGAYSAVPTGTTPKDRDFIAEPTGRLYITGEGVSRYIGYTHGAYLAGIDTASAILESAIFDRSSDNPSIAMPFRPTLFVLTLAVVPSLLPY